MQYLQNKDIDTTRWNICILQAHNSMPYAYSWYLDALTNGQWDALVWGNYEAVLPLPYKKKWCIAYLYPPFWAQQLGVFSIHPLRQELLQQFIAALPKQFKYIDLLLNEGNHFAIKGVSSLIKINYILPLSKTYQQIYKNYNKNTKRNLQKANKKYWHPLHLTVIRNISPSLIVQLYQKQIGKRTPHIKLAHYQQLEMVLYQCMHKQMGFSIGVYDEYNTLCGANFFIQTPQRLINLVSVTNAIGRKYRVTFVLIDYIIQQFSESPYLLDFEGSMIPSIAQFYAGFGAKPIPYQNIRLNRLPWYIKWLKK